jgi:GNAT superfamily N-acetyltransferase
MSSQSASPLELEFRPVTPERWPDLESLFGEHGAYDGCWCMWWRLTRSEFAERKGQENKAALKSIVEAGEVPGLLAYADGQPVAWCSVAPRETFAALERSRTLARIDEEPVWSIVCFFVAGPFRGKGVTPNLLRAAVDYAQAHGAKIVEGYPVDPARRLSSASAYTGLASTFRQAGFVEVLRRSETRPVMRRVVAERQ